jgi:hypothetical protein
MAMASASGSWAPGCWREGSLGASNIFQKNPALLPWCLSSGITPNSRPPELPAGLLLPPPTQRSSASPVAIGFAMKVRVGSMGNLNSVPMRR